MLHASTTPGDILGGLDFHGTCCPVDKSYQEKITLLLEICNLSWHGVSPWLLSTADYTQKLTSHLFNCVFLSYADPGWDLCVPLIGVSQQYARVPHFLVKKKKAKKQAQTQITKHLKPSRPLPASKETSSQDTAKI